MDGKRTPLDERFKAFIWELGSVANDPQMQVSIDPRLTQFIEDLFAEIQKAIRAERDKKSSATAAQFWGTVMEAVDQLKRRAIEP